MGGLSEPFPGLFFGGIEICTNYVSSAAVVHACKDPCFRRVAGQPDKHSPTYLSVEGDRHLYLNLIDPPKPLFYKRSFDVFLDFVDRFIYNGNVFIHCNAGLSRSPSLCLLWMAKRGRALPKESYEAASREFCKLYPYNPSLGIQTWLTEHWSELK